MFRFVSTFDASRYFTEMDVMQNEVKTIFFFWSVGRRFWHRESFHHIRVTGKNTFKVAQLAAKCVNDHTF